MSNEIQIYSRIQDPLAAIERMGQFFAKSGMFGCERMEQGQVLAMECLATNKPPSVISRSYHIMDGKLSKKALAALAEFNGIGGKHKWLKTGDDGKEAELQLTLDGNTITTRFSIDDARRAGIHFKSKSGNDTVWTKSPGNMLRARCISNGVAMLAPGIYAGDVEEYDAPTQTVDAPLLADKPTPAPTIDVQTVAPVVHAPVVLTAPTAPNTPAPVEVLEDAEAEIAPVQESATPSVERERFVAQPSPNGPGISAETQAELAEVIGVENLDAALVWLINRGRLPKDGNLSHLSVAYAQKIFDKPAQFLAVIAKA